MRRTSRLRRRGRLRALLLGVHLGAGAGLHETVDNDAIVGADALLDDAQIVGGELPERHVFDARGILIVDDDDVSARLLGADGDVRDQQPLVRRRAGHPHAREHARREHPVGVREHGTAADRAGRALDDIVDEVHAAFVIEVASRQ